MESAASSAAERPRNVLQFRSVPLVCVHSPAARTTDGGESGSSDSVNLPRGAPFP